MAFKYQNESTKQYQATYESVAATDVLHAFQTNQEQSSLTSA
jgi:hypothetical protein